MDKRCVAASEFKANCLRLMDEVARERRPIIITKRGKPVAKLVPFEPPETTDVKRVVSEMLAYRDTQKRTLDGITIRELVEEGRR